MIIDLPDTNTSAISSKLVAMRERGGEVTTGRVLTLIVVAHTNDDVEEVISAANDASREHPSRVLVLLTGAADTAGSSSGLSRTARSDSSESAESYEDFAESTSSGEAEPGVTDSDHPCGRMDAEIRIGGDAGASEVIVMKLFGEMSKHQESVVTPLLLPDTPIVAWWPVTPPRIPSADPIGRIASRRITDSLADTDDEGIFSRRTSYTPGDSDLAWSRITQWRGVLASALDEPPFSPIRGATICGPADDPSVDIAAGWMADRLGMNVVREASDSPKIPLDSKGRPTIGIEKLTLHRDQGTITMETVTAHTVKITREGSDRENLVALVRRGNADCIAEELRHLDPDLVYAKALRGLTRVRRTDAFASSPVGASRAFSQSHSDAASDYDDFEEEYQR